MEARNIEAATDPDDSELEATILPNKIVKPEEVDASKPKNWSFLLIS